MVQKAVRVGVIGVIFSLVAPALAQAPHDDAAALADLFRVDGWRSGVVEANAVLQSADGQPTLAHLSQEGTAAARWTGRTFLAGGKQLDGRAAKIQFDPADPSPPAGWKRERQLLVHEESGLACVLDLDLGEGKASRTMILADIVQYDQRGRDVSCNYVMDGMTAISLYASFYPDISAEDHAKSAVAAMAQNFTIKKALPVTVAEVSRKDDSGKEVMLPSPIAGGFDVGEINGVPCKTAIWLAKTHGWHVKARATYAQSDITAETIAALLFAVNYSRIDIKNEADPTVGGAEA